MDLLLFFALPIATIILAIVWQRIIKSPILVALTAFAIFLIVTFAVFDSDFLIFAIVYTILAYIAAWISKLICKILERDCIIQNLTAENITTDTLSANTLEINDDDDNNNNHNNCHNNSDNNSDNSCNNRYSRNLYRRY